MLAERRRRLAAGERHVGWKVAFGARPAQERFGIEGPLIGYLTDAGLLPDGAGVLLYTDGLTEARHDGTLFGLEGVGAALCGLHRPSPTEAVAILRARVAEFAYGTLTDDLCLLAARGT